MGGAAKTARRSAPPAARPPGLPKGPGAAGLRGSTRFTVGWTRADARGPAARPQRSRSSRFSDFFMPLPLTLRFGVKPDGSTKTLIKEYGNRTSKLAFGPFSATNPRCPSPTNKRHDRGPRAGPRRGPAAIRASFLARCTNKMFAKTRGARSTGRTSTKSTRQEKSGLDMGQSSKKLRSDRAEEVQGNRIQEGTMGTARRPTLRPAGGAATPNFLHQRAPTTFSAGGGKTRWRALQGGAIGRRDSKEGRTEEAVRGGANNPRGQL